PKAPGEGGCPQTDSAKSAPHPDPLSRSRIYPTSAADSDRTRVNPSSVASGERERTVQAERERTETPAAPPPAATETPPPATSDTPPAGATPPPAAAPSDTTEAPPPDAAPPATTEAPPATPPPPRAGNVDVRESLCLMIESAARAQNLPLEFFARVIWQESRFQPGVVGPRTRSGDRAQGIAQFMPRTAAERGLLDPFDPVQALPK